ncbi:MAG: YhfC family glutamic-type intramembrane protease [Ruthenibacterium sp.]
MVSFWAIGGTIFTLLISFGVPITMLVLLKKKTGKGLAAAAVGALCFFVGAMILEQLLHSLVFSLVPTLRLMPIPYVLYGCFAAGIFEETARLLGLKLLCRKDKSAAIGFGYGIGHGGIEAILVVGVLAALNLSAMLGAQELPAAQIAQLNAAPAFVFFMGGVERIFAIALHLALSMLIWMVVVKRLPFYFYFVSILLHALCNAAAALAQVGVLTSLWAVEAYTGIFAVAVCVLVWALYEKTKPTSAVNVEDSV